MAVRMGHWLPDAVNLVKTQQARLSQLPTTIFSVPLSGTCLAL